MPPYSLCYGLRKNLNIMVNLFKTSFVCSFSFVFFSFIFFYFFFLGGGVSGDIIMPIKIDKRVVLYIFSDFM